MSGPPTTAALEARDFGVQRHGKVLLEGITLTVPTGTIAALVGPAASGKSLFLRCINRLTEVEGAISTRGELRLMGQDVYAPHTDLLALRRRVGMVFTQPSLPVVSVFDNVALAPRMAGLHDRHHLAAIVERSLRQVHLWEAVAERLATPAAALTVENQQRLCIARALAAEPAILLFDEPTAQLDYPSAVRIEDLIIDLGKRYPIVVAAQSPQQASHVAGMTAFFYHGQLIEVGPTEEVLTNPVNRTTEAYLTGRLAE